MVRATSIHDVLAEGYDTVAAFFRLCDPRLKCV